MPKSLIWPLLLLALAQTSLAQSLAPQSLDVNDFLEAGKTLPPGQELDIAYQHIIPRFEQKQDPDKQMAVEIYFSEYDGSEKSKRKLRWIKELLSDEKAASKDFAIEALAMGPDKNDLEESRAVKSITKQLNIEDYRVDAFHEGVHFEAPLLQTTSPATKEAGREPSGKMNSRVFWSLIRTTTTAGGVYASLVIAQGVSPAVAATLGLIPGLASAGLTYFSGHYGAWLTSGRWAGWLLDSPSFLAKTLRKGLGLTPANFQKSLVKKRNMFKREYPELYKSMPEAFEKKVQSSAKEATSARKARLARIMTRLRSAEEYVKWWVAEVVFTSIALKTPQALAGISEVTSITGAAGEVLMGSTMGMAAQGPGDIAIQLRKYQMVEELRDEIKAGRQPNPSVSIAVEGKRVEASLLEEIEMVLAKSGAHKNYTITDFSHQALQKIENWARARATMLSFFSVVGVGMEIAHIPLARPWLIAVGIGGGAYYAKVRGWARTPSSDGMKNLLRKYQNDQAASNMRSVFARMCQNKFLVRR